MHVATRRLISASEALDPASRALLNIWIHQRLDDDTVARMSGTSAARIEERRRAIVEQLASQLGAAPQDVSEAIARLAEPPAPEAQLARDNGSAADRPAPARPRTDTNPQVKPEILPWKQATGSPHRRLTLGVLGLLAITALAIAAAANSGGGGAPAASSANGSTPTSTGARPEPLLALPGGFPGAAGTIDVSAAAPHPTLRISISGLPAPRTGHYEGWLYNSIIDCRPLGSVSAGGPPLTVPLPVGYTRYRYFDVSLQPSGDNPNHSGQSVLRASTAQP